MRFNFTISKHLEYKSDEHLLTGFEGEKIATEKDGFGASIQINSITKIEDFDQIEKQLAKARKAFKLFTENRLENG